MRPIAAFVIAGWLVALLSVTTGGGSDFLLPHRYLPALPTVAAPYDPTSDVVSVVPLLFRALALAVAAAAVASMGKAWAAVNLSPSSLSYGALTLVEVALFTDVFRALAPDWTVYALHFGHIITLSARSYELSRRIAWGAPLPSLLVVLGALAIVRRQSPSQTEFHPE